MSEEVVKNQFLNTTRVLARIACADDHLSDQEQLVLASGIGGAANLSVSQIGTLFKDIEERPPIGHLVSEIRDIESVKQLLIDLSALAIVKVEWHPNELSALQAAVESLSVESRVRDNFLSALELLREASSLINNPNSDFLKESRQ